MAVDAARTQRKLRRVYVTSFNSPHLRWSYFIWTERPWSDSVRRGCDQSVRSKSRSSPRACTRKRCYLKDDRAMHRQK